MDALGNPLKLFLTGGEVHDIVPASDLLSDFSNCNVLADKGYDSAALVVDLESINNTTVIPPRSNRKNPRGYDHHLYKERHLVECFFKQDEAVSPNSNALREACRKLFGYGNACGFNYMAKMILKTRTRKYYIFSGVA